MVDRVKVAIDAALLGHEHAKTALDLPCWDIFGKRAGLPCCDLLGGRTNVHMPIIDSMPVDEPEVMRKNVADLRAKGYRGHSIKVEGEPVTEAARIASALADRKSSEFFIVDANGGLTVKTARWMLKLLPGELGFVLEAPSATRRKCLSL